MEEKINVGKELANNYLLGKLTVRLWSGKKTDKEATAELLASKGAVANAASVVKNLMAGKDGKLKETISAYTSIRTWFYERTVPWTANSVGAMKGDRLIATADSINFLGEFAKLKKQAEDVKQEFLAEYDDAIKDVAQSLGALYNPANYPSKAEINSLFGAEMGLSPLPEGTDFKRLKNVPANLVDGLIKLHESNVEAQMNNALSDVQRRLLSELTRMDTQLSKVAKGEKTRLFKSMVGNLRQLTNMARSMNFCDNPEITAIVDNIELHLLKHEVDSYKDNAALASSVVEKARAIKKLVNDDENWTIKEGDGEVQLPLELEEEVTDIIEEPEAIDESTKEIQEDMSFLASLTAADDEEEEEIVDEEDKEETPDFDDTGVFFA